MNFDILIRCKNEVEWLPYTKSSIDNQSIKPINIIFVDSGSNDGSRELANSYGWHIIDYKRDQFNYSESLNLGFLATKSDAVLILSAHCILVGSESIGTMMSELNNDKKTCAVFGRQIPTSKSSPHDIRDLLTVFGRERIVYNKMPFFHNAFSLIRRKNWEEENFDEGVNGIEDRLWANNMAKKGYKVVYQPDAIVYHEHGLNHGLCEKRALRVVRALKTLHANDPHIIWPKNI